MIKTEVITGNLVKEINDIIDTDLVNKIFKSKLWIAGGFAREVAHKFFNISSRSLSTYLLPREGKGDIDFFSHDINIVQKVIDEILSTNSDMSHYSINNTYNHFKNVYTDNFWNKSCTIQLVNKFEFKNIKQCFDSFDVTNCKYAISKENGKYILHYDTAAKLNDIKKTLHISNSNSPYTLSRIHKYLNFRCLDKMSECEESKEEFSKCLYKIVENNWDKIYKISDANYLMRSLKRLNSTVTLSNKEISMFVGMFKDRVIDSQEEVYSGSGYGVFIRNIYKDVDWAINTLSQNT